MTHQYRQTSEAVGYFLPSHYGSVAYFLFCVDAVLHFWLPGVNISIHQSAFCTFLTIKRKQLILLDTHSGQEKNTHSTGRNLEQTWWTGGRGCAWAERKNRSKKDNGDINSESGRQAIVSCCEKIRKLKIHVIHIQM